MHLGRLKVTFVHTVMHAIHPFTHTHAEREKEPGGLWGEREREGGRAGGRERI